jgi:hypothetical protein
VDLQDGIPAEELSRRLRVVEFGAARSTTVINHHDPEEAMKYLCLVYVQAQKLAALSTSEMDALVRESLAYDEALRNSGHYVCSEALQPVQTATTVRVRNGKLSTTDGPFAATKEQLGGFILIDARDLNEAIQVASKIPPGQLGCIEVRPIMDLSLS